MDKKFETLIQGYFTKAQEKLEAAKTLFKTCAYDDAVSRAYYATYHAAQAILLTEGLIAETHQGLINLFGLHFVKTGKFEKKYGRFLSSLKDERENGDYSVYSSIDEMIASNAIKEAEDFVEEMKRFIKKNLT
ncbi:MAG: HEPN domain-containing protein [Chlamydiae bacterium]|nr:HEPN domain-containing protein [Chlamydiota bacterium]MBI3276288.1 HEPN domain-containing protein [Chlamydiota bacterium]